MLFRDSSVANVCWDFIHIPLKTSFVSPFFQDKARSYIRNSNIDFFSSLIKEGKFIDTVSDLTIFIESKDVEGNYINIFLNDSIEAKAGQKGAPRLVRDRGGSGAALRGARVGPRRVGARHL